MNDPVILTSQIITILRYIHPIDRISIDDAEEYVPNRWLAVKDLRIGNSIDNKESKHHIGTWIDENRWPVYIIQTDEELNYFMTKNEWLTPSGSVIYVAKVDLRTVNIGANASFGTKGQNKLQSTLLKLSKSNGHFCLRTEDDLSRFEDKLMNKFNISGEMVDLKGEFFLNKYEGWHQLDEETIYKSDGKKFIDITDRILQIRQSL